MKRLFLAYCLGAASVVFLLYQLGPETVVQIGLRFAAASTPMDWTSVPRAQAATLPAPARHHR